jgi:hypothetical protein
MAFTVREKERSVVQHASLYAALAHCASCMTHKTMTRVHVCCLPVVCLPGYEGIGCTPCRIGYFRAGEVSTTYTPPPFCIQCSYGLTTQNNASTLSGACTGRDCPEAHCTGPLHSAWHFFVACAVGCVMLFAQCNTVVELVGRGVCLLGSRLRYVCWCSILIQHVIPHVCTM